MEELIVDNFSEIKIGLNIFEKDNNEGNTIKSNDTINNSNTDIQSADDNINFNVSCNNNSITCKEKK